MAMFVTNSLRLATGVGAAAAFGLPSRATLAQTAPRPIRRSERYEDSFITERKPYKWPDNNTLAVWFVPNVEVWHYDSAFGVGISPNPTNHVPDVFNYAWREYGMRVGLWRLADVLDEAGLKATVALNSQVCDVYPKAVEQMKERGWEFMGHGTTNSITSPASIRSRNTRLSAASSTRSLRLPGSARAAGSARGWSRPTTPSTSLPRKA